MVNRTHVRILVGCEGESENGYAAFLARRARDAGILVHIQPQVMKGGDPLAMLEWFDDWIGREEDRRGPFDLRFALIDTDRDAMAPQRAQQARHMAQKIGVEVIWQNPVHEAVVLRHFDGHETKRPPDGQAALQQLVKVWATYRKGLPAVHYAKVLTDAHLSRVCGVEPELKYLLVSANLVTA